MTNGAPLKTIKQLIGQTPLIVNPDRDAVVFQDALASLSTERLQSFYRTLSSEDRRRFHYVANICLGFESWSRLYQELVIPETHARLTDRLEDAFAQRAEDLQRREEELQAEWDSLEKENVTLRRENLNLKNELFSLQETYQTLQRQQQQLLALVERYKTLFREFKSFMPSTDAFKSN